MTEESKIHTDDDDAAFDLLSALLAPPPVETEPSDKYRGRKLSLIVEAMIYAMVKTQPAMIPYVEEYLTKTKNTNDPALHCTDARVMLSLVFAIKNGIYRYPPEQGSINV